MLVVVSSLSFADWWGLLTADCGWTVAAEGFYFLQQPAWAK